MLHGESADSAHVCEGSGDDGPVPSRDYTATSTSRCFIAGLTSTGSSGGLTFTRLLCAPAMKIHSSAYRLLFVLSPSHGLHLNRRCDYINRESSDNNKSDLPGSSEAQNNSNSKSEECL